MKYTNKRNIIYYGHFPCEKCGRIIVQVSKEQGGQKLNVPDSPIYPNSEWTDHFCGYKNSTQFHKFLKRFLNIK